MSEVVLKEVQDGVATITLNRPERLNAWTQQLERDYFAALGECAASQEVRVIVVTGAGRGFCAGADMQELQSLGEDGVGRGPAQRRAHRADLPADGPQADHRGDQRAVRGDRAGAGADVRHPLRRRGRQADDGVRAPRAGRRARHLVGAAAPGRARRGAGPAAVRSRGARARGRRDGPRQRRDAGRDGARAGARLRARPRRQLLAGEHGDDEAPGLRRPRARRCPTRWTRPTG